MNAEPHRHRTGQNLSQNLLQGAASTLGESGPPLRHLHHRHQVLGSLDQLHKLGLVAE
jgi:hypothetical protein